MAEVTILPSDDRYSEVALSGRLDIQGCEAVELRLTAATAGRNYPAIVDMTDVSLMASVGVGMIVRIANALRVKGQPMVLFGAADSVDSILRAMKIDALVDLVPHRDDAVARVLAWGRGRPTRWCNRRRSRHRRSFRRRHTPRRGRAVRCRR